MFRWKELEECVYEEFDPEHEFTKLIPSLIGVDPDDAFCRVPYEKGSTFLWYLEELVGGSAVFEPFLKKYFQTFAYKSLDSDQFKQFFTDYFRDKTGVDCVDWNTWFYSPGMPPYKPTLDTSLADQCWTEGQKWLDLDSGKVESLENSLLLNIVCQISECDISQDAPDMSPTQIQEFLSFIIQKQSLKSQTLEKLDSVYKFSSSTNCDILCLFLRLGLRSKWEPGVDLTFQFLKTMGRLKYVRPLYRDLSKWEEKKELTVKFFQENKHLLMSSVVDGVKKDLNC